MILNNSYQVSMEQEYHLNRTTICLQVPLYHCFGMVLGSLSSICHGITVVLPSPTFNAEESLKAIQNEKYSYKLKFITLEILTRYDLILDARLFLAPQLCSSIYIIILSYHNTTYLH